MSYSRRLGCENPQMLIIIYIHGWIKKWKKLKTPKKGDIGSEMIKYATVYIIEGEHFHTYKMFPVEMDLLTKEKRGDQVKLLWNFVLYLKMRWNID